MLTGVFAVGGRGDESNKGTSAEFIPFETSKDVDLKWVELPFLKKPHSNMPGVAFMDDILFVIGGGGVPFPGGEKTVMGKYFILPKIIH